MRRLQIMVGAKPSKIVKGGRLGVMCLSRLPSLRLHSFHPVLHLYPGNMIYRLPVSII